MLGRQQRGCRRTRPQSMLGASASTAGGARRGAGRPSATVIEVVTTYAVRPHVAGCRRIDRVRRGQDAVWGARADARWLGGAFLTGRELLHRRARGRAGGRRLRRG